MGFVPVMKGLLVGLALALVLGGGVLVCIAV